MAYVMPPDYVLEDIAATAARRRDRQRQRNDAALRFPSLTCKVNARAIGAPRS